MLVKIPAVHLRYFSLQLVFLLAEQIVARNHRFFNKFVHILELLIISRAHRNLVLLAPTLA